MSQHEDLLFSALLLGIPVQLPTGTVLRLKGNCSGIVGANKSEHTVVYDIYHPEELVVKVDYNFGPCVWTHINCIEAIESVPPNTDSQRLLEQAGEWIEAGLRPTLK